MINKITIQNFKSIKDRVEIDMKPITLLFGPNSAGKSTVVQAIHYLKEVIQYDNPDPRKTAVGGDSIDLGGFKNIVHRESGDSADHYKTKDIVIGIEIENSENIEPNIFDQEFPQVEDLLYQAGENPYYLEFTISWDERLKRPIVKKYEVSIKNEIIGRIEMTGYAAGSELKLENLVNAGGEFNLENPEIPKFNLKYINYEHSDFIWSEKLQKQEKPQSTLEDENGDIVENIFELYIKDFDDILFETKNTFLKSSDGDEIPLISLPNAADPETFIEGDNSNFTLFYGNQAFPNFKNINTKHNFKNVELSEDDVNKRSSIEKALSQIFSTPILLLSDFLKTIRYIGPVRSIPERDFTPEEYSDENNWSNGLAAWAYLHALVNKNIIDKNNDIDNINSWMQKLGLGYTIKIHSVYKIDEDSPLVYGMDENGNYFEDNEDLRKAFSKLPTVSEAVLVESKNGIDVKPNDVGSGITQVFPIIVSTVADKHSLLAIEQPELHVHPRIQQQIADMLVSNYKNSTIYLIETHSEHLLLRILRRVNETFDGETESKELEISHKDISLVYVEPGDKGVEMRKMPIDPTTGDLVDYPEGFFGERSLDLR